MKVADLNLSRDLSFDFAAGLVTFKNTRIVMFDADAVGLLRQSILEQVGLDGARRVFFRFGYQHGVADFMQTKLSYNFDTEMDLLASGPVIHTWEGIVKAEPTEISFHVGASPTSCRHAECPTSAAASAQRSSCGAQAVAGSP